MAVNPSQRWKLGLFVVLTSILGFVTLVWLGTVGLSRNKTRVVSYFDESVQGLDVGSAVKFRGVRIGRVARIGIAPDRRHVEVTSEVDLKALARLGVREGGPRETGGGIVPLDMRIQLVPLGITGLMFLQVDVFDPEDLESQELPFKPPWNYFPSTRSTLKSAGDAVMEVLNRFPEIELDASIALAEASETFRAVRLFIEPKEGGEGVAVLVARLEAAATSLERAASSLDSAIRMADVGRTMASIRQAADSVAEAADEATGLGGELRGELVPLREALQSVRALADTLERDPSAVLRGRSSDLGPRGRR